jgi:hypothetical protein
MGVRSITFALLGALLWACGGGNVALRPQADCFLTATPRWTGSALDGPYDDVASFCAHSFTVDERVFHRCRDLRALPMAVPKGWKQLGDPYLSVRRYTAVNHEDRRVCLLRIETGRGSYMGQVPGICGTEGESPNERYAVDRLALVHQLAPREPLLRVHIVKSRQRSGAVVERVESVVYCGTGDSGRMSCIEPVPVRVRRSLDQMGTRSRGGESMCVSDAASVDNDEGMSTGWSSVLSLTLGTDGRLSATGRSECLDDQQKRFLGHTCLYFP